MASHCASDQAQVLTIDFKAFHHAYPVYLSPTSIKGHSTLSFALGIVDFRLLSECLSNVHVPFSGHYSSHDTLLSTTLQGLTSTPLAFSGRPYMTSPD